MFSAYWNSHIHTVLLIVGCSIGIYIRRCKRKVIGTQSLCRNKINRSLNCWAIRICDSNRFFRLRVSRNSYYLCIRDLWTPPTCDHINFRWRFLFITFCSNTLSCFVIIIGQTCILCTLYKHIIFFPTSPQPISLVESIEVVRVRILSFILSTILIF